MKIELELPDSFPDRARQALSPPKATSSHADVASLLEEVVRQIDSANEWRKYSAPIARVDALYSEWQDLRPEIEAVALKDELAAGHVTRAVHLSREVDRLLDKHDDLRLRAINAWMHTQMLPAKVYA